jgi:hypothetical protein
MRSRESSCLFRFFILISCTAVITAITTPALCAQSEDELAHLFRQHRFKQTITKPPQGILKHPYLVPSGPYFQLFDWDMYFMGVALSYDGVGKPLASSIEDFLDFVNKRATRPGVCAAGNCSGWLLGLAGNVQAISGAGCGARVINFAQFPLD